MAILHNTKPQILLLLSKCQETAGKAAKTKQNEVYKYRQCTYAFHQKNKTSLPFIKLISQVTCKDATENVQSSFWRYKSPLFAVKLKNTLSQLSFHILIFNSCEDTLVAISFLLHLPSFMVFNSLLDYFYTRVNFTHL